MTYRVSPTDILQAIIKELLDGLGDIIAHNWDSFKSNNQLDLMIGDKTYKAPSAPLSLEKKTKVLSNSP